MALNFSVENKKEAEHPPRSNSESSGAGRSRAPEPQQSSLSGGAGYSAMARAVAGASPAAVWNGIGVVVPADAASLVHACFPNLVLEAP